MKSKPEGKDEHGEEKVGAIRGENPEDRSYLNFDKVETLGTSSEIPVLVLPAGKRIEFQIASADVVHSFWVPEFLFKRDVMPDPQANHTENVFQISEIQLPDGKSSSAFVGRCAEMCGTYHSMMNFEVRVVSPDDFKAYLQQRVAGVGDQGVDGGALALLTATYQVGTIGLSLSTAQALSRRDNGSTYTIGASTPFYTSASDQLSFNASARPLMFLV